MELQWWPKHLLKLLPSWLWNRNEGWSCTKLGHSDERASTGWLSQPHPKWNWAHSKSAVALWRPARSQRTTQRDWFWWLWSPNKRKILAIDPRFTTRPVSIEAAIAFDWLAIAILLCFQLHQHWCSWLYIPTIAITRLWNGQNTLVPNEQINGPRSVWKSGRPIR